MDKQDSNQGARQKPVRGFDKAAQVQRESDRRVEAQRVASLQMTAKIKRLRALRLERDAQVASQVAEAAAEAPKASKKKKSSAA